MMKIKKTLMIMLAFLIVAVVVVAIDFIPSGDIEGLGIYGMKNFTNVSVTGKFYQDNKELLDSSWDSLSNFTDNLGDRGYTELSNFTNDEGFISNSFSSDVDANAYSLLNASNITFSNDLNHRIYDNETCIIIVGDTSEVRIC